MQWELYETIAASQNVRQKHGATRSKKGARIEQNITLHTPRRSQVHRESTPPVGGNGGETALTPAKLTGRDEDLDAFADSPNVKVRIGTPAPPNDALLVPPTDALLTE